MDRPKTGSTIESTAVRHDERKILQGFRYGKRGQARVHLKDENSITC